MKKFILFILSGIAMVVAYLLFKPSAPEVIPPTPQPNAEASNPEGRPNILVIVADDMGYTDLGSYGSEIETPNLDALANAGTQFSQFHVAPACAPARAMLMTGVDNHITGLGAFNKLTLTPNQEGVPGYEAQLNKRAASMGEIFIDAGYHTYTTGKWHLGYGADSSPPAHGFQRSMVLLEGGAGHFTPLPVLPFTRSATYREDGRITEAPEDFYSSDYYVDKMIDYIEQDKATGRPFLGVLSFTAPHWPLQAKPETIKKYQGKYLEGYEVLADKRRQALVERGLLQKNVTPAPYQHDEPRPWDSLNEEERLYEDKRMAVYAAMIDDMDQAFGRLVQHLKDNGQYDNTLFVFLSDNGTEGHEMQQMVYTVQMNTLFGMDCCDNSFENIGNANSFLDLDPYWAAASAGPHRIYKGFPTQGGIVSPAFIAGKNLVQTDVYKDFASVKDILPTLLDYAGIANHGESFAGRKVFPIEGKSIRPLLTGTADTVHGKDFTMGWQLFGKHGIRAGDWKLLRMPPPYGNDEWELYHVVSDPAESNNLAEQNPEQLKIMIQHWEDYREHANVIFPEGILFSFFGY